MELDAGLFLGLAPSADAGRFRTGMATGQARPFKFAAKVQAEILHVQVHS